LFYFYTNYTLYTIQTTTVSRITTSTTNTDLECSAQFYPRMIEDTKLPSKWNSK
ncbi:unnamed protein product, partial [Rotaria sp. Silwood2]